MKDPFTFPSNSGKKLDSFKTDIECKKRLLPLYEDPGSATALFGSAEMQTPRWDSVSESFTGGGDRKQRER